jgi:aarF domain-containing kinase
VEEAVAAVDAMSREALGEALRLVLSSGGAVAALRAAGAEALGPLRALLMPLPIPVLGLLPGAGAPRRCVGTLA